MTPAVVKELIERRPFKSVIELNKFLLEQKLTPDQAKEFYRKASRDQFEHRRARGIPADSRRRLSPAELAEYRTWKTWAQFDKEIGEYVGQQETDRLKQC